MTPRELFERIELAIAASGTIGAARCVSCSRSAPSGPRSPAAARSLSPRAEVRPARRCRQRARAAAGDRVHRGPSDARLRAARSRPTSPVAHLDLARLARARAERHHRLPHGQRLLARPCARGADRCPCCAIPGGASRRVLAHTASRKQTASRPRGHAAGARRAGHRARPRRRAGGRIAPPCPPSCATSASACRRRRSIMIVVPPIADAASQRAAAGYDLRDLSRPATLVLRAWGGVHAAKGPHPIASLGWYKRTLRYTLAHAPRSKVDRGAADVGRRLDPRGVAQRSQAELFRLARPAALQQAAGARSRAGRTSPGSSPTARCS